MIFINFVMTTTKPFATRIAGLVQQLFDENIKCEKSNKISSIDIAFSQGKRWTIHYFGKIRLKC